MRVAGPTGAGRRVAGVGAMVLAGLLMMAGCSRPATSEQAVEVQSSPSSVPALRLDEPEKLLSGWPMSSSRILHDRAQQSMGGFKKLLEGEPTSAVGAAYQSPDEQYTALVSGVSGRVVEPSATLNKIFAGLPRLSDVKPAQVGPMGGEVRCGRGETGGVDVVTCAWADHHSIGMVAFLGLPRSESADEMFVRVRSQLEHPVT